MRRRKGLPGLSFSWKRALGISAFKAKTSRKTGLPMSRYGRQRKMGRAMGCCVPAVLLAGGGTSLLAGSASLLAQAML